MMTLSTAGCKLKKALLSAAIISFAVLMSSCDSLFFDDEGDCSVHYLLSFRYTKNILNADAFGSQVTDVNVAFYDSNGKMLYKKSEHRTLTTENDFKMEVDVAPGQYDIIAWCEGSSVIDSATSFVLQGQNIGDSKVNSGAYLQLEEENGMFFHDKDINRLYYGILKNVEFPDSYGKIDIEPISLTKDTNHLTLQLQNINGDPVDPDQLIFEIEGENSELNWENALVGNKKFTYTPWAVESTYSTNEEPSRTTMADGEIPNGVLAEFTMGRILANKGQRMTVRIKGDEKPIISIPLVEYLLLVRNHYEEAVSAQDYLDRYDDFTMLFFIDESYTWVKSRIYINNWRVVPPQEEHI